MEDAREREPPPPFHLGDWRVDPASCRIHKEGVELKLEPKVMEVLLCLASHAGEVVSREQLEEHAWQGMVVGYDALSSSIIKLRKALGDDSRQPRYIETVSKRGYRLIAPVVAGEPGAEQAVAEVQTGRAGMGWLRPLLVAGGTLLIVVALWLLLTPTPEGAARQRSPQSATASPSIVVLPFKNLSDDPSQDYFAEGIHDDIITDLSRIGTLRVIANQSAYHYLDQAVDLQRIASELKVQYVVQGSVQRTGQRIRINVQLTNAEKGEHVWAERFDSDEKNLFDIQDQLSQRVIDAMFVTLSSEEHALLGYRTTSNFAAYDSFLQGQRHSRDRSKLGFEQAEAAYRRALELDPDYARAYGALAVLYTNAYRHNWSTLTLAEARERALNLALKAEALDRSSQQVYWSLGFVHLFRKEYAEAEQAAKQAVAISPNYADGLGLLAFIANWRGKSQDAIAYIRRATDLNPYYTFDYPWNLGLAYYTEGRTEESIAAIQEALERNETAEFPRMFLAANYVRAGREDDAEWEIEQVVMQRPGTTLSHLETTIPFEKREQLDTLLDELRTAGMSE